MNRKTSFVCNMNRFKSDHLNMLGDMKNERKDKEESDRATFNRRRYLSRENVQKSNMHLYQTNNNTFNDIKT